MNLRVEQFNQRLKIVKVYCIIFLYHSEIRCNSVNVAFSGEPCKFCILL
jgi:hypothetical protein